VSFLSISVTHHSSRERELEVLLASLGSYRDRVRVCTDPGTTGSWPTTKECWTNLPESSYHLVLQDDVVVCRDFVPGLIRAIRHRPAAIVAPYSGRWGKKALEAKEGGRSWVKLPGHLSGQAICMPTVWARSFIPWHDAWEPPYDSEFWVKEGCTTKARLEAARANWSDWRVMQFAKHNRLPIWFTVPSLVDHQGAMSGVNPRGNSSNKRAQLFIGEDTSALSVDWRVKR
jgi:hypothetical protein